MGRTLGMQLKSFFQPIIVLGIRLFENIIRLI